jgi:hypothetical protein
MAIRRKWVRCAVRVCVAAVGVWAALTATRVAVTVGACVALWRLVGSGTEVTDVDE